MLPFVRSTTLEKERKRLVPVLSQLFVTFSPTTSTMASHLVSFRPFLPEILL